MTSQISPQSFRAFEIEVCHQVRQLGWHVQSIGMQTYDNTTKTFLGRTENATRHEPDFLAVHPSGAHCYLEVKGTTNRHRHSSNFTIECWSLMGCLLKDFVAPSFIVWHDLTTSEPLDVYKSNPSVGPRSFVGSGDDYYLVSRSAIGLTSIPLHRRLELVRRTYGSKGGAR